MPCISGPSSLTRFQRSSIANQHGFLSVSGVVSYSLHHNCRESKQNDNEGAVVSIIYSPRTAQLDLIMLTFWLARGEHRWRDDQTTSKDYSWDHYVLAEITPPGECYIFKLNVRPICMRSQLSCSLPQRVFATRMTHPLSLLAGKWWCLQVSIQFYFVDNPWSMVWPELN